MPAPTEAQLRASGQTPAAEETAKVAKANDEPIEARKEDFDPTKFRTPGFARMRVDWRSDDRTVIQRATSAVDARILRNFADAYEVMGQVYDLVRTPEYDEDGTAKTDRFGMVIWARTPAGGFDEDFTRLTVKQKEDLMFKITTRIFAWEQAAADAWGEAMFAKAQWEERFSIGYDAPMTGTIDDRTAKGRLEALEERYFAIFLTLYSRKADAIVRSLELLGQRLKDSMV